MGKKSEKEHPKVFISYSHKDEEWKDRLVTHLGVLQQQGALEVWDDRRIKGGDNWYEEIEKALNSANIAILMISANFLTSDFILGKEVPPLLERRQNEGVRVIPVIVKPCVWQEVKWLKAIQARPKYGKPLSSMRGHRLDGALAALAKEIMDMSRGGGETQITEKAPAVPPDRILTAKLPTTGKDLFGREDELGILAQSRPERPREVAGEIVNRRMENAVEAVGLTNSISYVLVSYPGTAVDITGLFESRTSEVVKLIDNPPELRHAGFDISTQERSRIINGEFRRSVLKSYKLLDVWRDGTIVSVGDGGEGFLCWGNYNKKEFLRVNTIALIESVYLFTLFVKGLFEEAEAPECRVKIALQLRNIAKDRKYGLPKTKPGSLSWQFNFERDIAWAPGPNVSASADWTWRNTAPEKAAYELVSELYAKFGVEHEFMPYVKEHDGEKVIDIEQIKNIS